MPAFTTIAIASQPHIRHTAPKPRAPLNSDERAKHQETREEKQSKIDAQVNRWFNDTLALADKMAAEFEMKPKYFLELFFQVTNPYNTFKAEKAAECRERGETKNAPQIHREYYDEYRDLSDEQKDEIVQ
ncbi:hypothetical protein DFH09DRAFT_1309368 [Mycena vulgaris]|nr:hypothetical protein DFH09DRAFT_1309368 [Mycena vulgaris]